MCTARANLCSKLKLAFNQGARPFLGALFLIRRVPFLQHCVNWCHICKGALLIGAVSGWYKGVISKQPLGRDVFRTISNINDENICVIAKKGSQSPKYASAKDYSKMTPHKIKQFYTFSTPQITRKLAHYFHTGEPRFSYWRAQQLVSIWELVLLNNIQIIKEK